MGRCSTPSPATVEGKFVMATERKKQEWSLGDVFLIPLLDGDAVPGQILDLMMPNVVTVVMIDDKTSADGDYEIGDLHRRRIITTKAVTRELLDSGYWRVLRGRDLLVPQPLWPNESTRKHAWVGAKVSDAGLLEGFMNAYYGLAPWDSYHDPLYLDKQLWPGTPRPVCAVLTRGGAISDPQACPAAESAERQGTGDPVVSGPALVFDLEMEDRAALEQLWQRSPRGASTTFEHFLYVPGLARASELTTRIQEAGFSTRVQTAVEEGGTLIAAKHTMVPSEAAFHVARTTLSGLMEEFGGVYEGWEAKVQSGD